MKFLVIQTAFIGDVILATAALEELHMSMPDAEIDFLVRKGNEALFRDHPFMREVIVWDKKKNKLVNLYKIIRQIRREKYDYVINLHRFASSGFVTVLSNAKQTIGYKQNPLSFLFRKTYPHLMGKSGESYAHEVERNHTLIASVTKGHVFRPSLYPTAKDFQEVMVYQAKPYVCIAPSSVWFTKQWPKEKWVELINLIPADYNIYLLGAPNDAPLAEEMIGSARRDNLYSFCGKLDFLQSAALMKKAAMNYVNDSAPMHIASAMNAPVTAIYCSTTKEFGFGPLSDVSYVIEEKQNIACRPCGLHGHKACPLGHFQCAMDIQPKDILEKTLNTHVEVS